mmetsp:Transcript_14849/g.44421  ORF Transcript_14849/g.44421 Transcript_14849/m.44421 type:complete len:351 (-) Transcript_14849:1317-2369(-)
MRLPSTFCWPTHAIICEMLMKEPLEPVVTMFLTLFVSLSDFCAAVPAVSRALLSTWLTDFSNDSIIVWPGWHSSLADCARSTRAFTSRLDASIVATMLSIVAASAIVSPIPMEYPRWMIQWLTTRWWQPKKARAPVGPSSLLMTWMRPPEEVPSVFLSSMPASSSPLSMMTRVSPGESSSTSSSGWPFANLKSETFCGRKRLMICLPVHSGSGLSTAGTGSCPEKESRCITRFITRSFLRKQSRLVKPREPSSVSCTMPITGLFDCGETMQRGTIMISAASARVSIDWSTCKFISSPSKSALYGDVHERFIRNVEYGKILTRCAMIDILCNDGCRLNITMSPSWMWRSTL